MENLRSFKTAFELLEAAFWDGPSVPSSILFFYYVVKSQKAKSMDQMKFHALILEATEALEEEGWQQIGGVGGWLPPQRVRFNGDHVDEIVKDLEALGLPSDAYIRPENEFTGLTAACWAHVWIARRGLL